MVPRLLPLAGSLKAIEYTREAGLHACNYRVDFGKLEEAFLPSVPPGTRWKGPVSFTLPIAPRA
jgi:hypothetical protein